MPKCRVVGSRVETHCAIITPAGIASKVKIMRKTAAGTPCWKRLSARCPLNTALRTLFVGSIVILWVSCLGARLALAGGFVLTAEQLDRVTAAGVVSESAGVALALGSSPRTATFAHASVDPETGDARGVGSAAGPDGATGAAWVTLSGDQGGYLVVSEANADGVSADAQPIYVLSEGSLDLAPGATAGQSAANATGADAFTNSSTSFEGGNGTDTITSLSVVDSYTSGDGGSRSETGIDVQQSQGTLRLVTSAEGEGGDITALLSQSSAGVELAGVQFVIAGQGEVASNRSGATQVTHVIFATEAGVFIRVVGSATHLGTGVLAPSATSSIAATGAADGQIATVDRSARRGGTARATTMMMFVPKATGQAGTAVHP